MSYERLGKQGAQSGLSTLLMDRNRYYIKVCLHLHHDRPWRDPVTMKRNRALMDELTRFRAYRALSGIAELSRDETLTIDGRPVYPPAG